MDQTEVEAAVAWADREGWEPGLTDAGPFFAADPDGFYATEVDGRIVATISAVRCSPRLAFLGFYIVEPGVRGTGLGKPLFDEILRRYDGLTLGGDAVPEQVANYESMGFEVAYRNARYSSAGLPDDQDAPLQARSAMDVDFDALVEFDGNHCFGPRPEFLKQWIGGPGRDSVVTTDSGGAVTGFAASRRTSLGHRIGPVFADAGDGDHRIAESLIRTLAGRLEGRIAVDVPQPNRAAVELLESFGMERSFETARIYRGPAPDLPLPNIYGITSLELG
jgi:GNAT superfamily N-acetyltransferase/ribosomal protein S18 acetylase RimI-like enzyme